MRLLNTASLCLTDFIGANVPPYAILSHTWGTEEILFEDLSPGVPPERATAKAGFVKVLGCCQKAAVDGFEWVWIDSCCIDKSSSAELSEAINSMYQWYKSSTICYAYLEDVTAASQPAGHHPSKFRATDFGKSRWFTRGWTLQELIAPETVELYTGEWVEIGTKVALAERLSEITGIPDKLLRGEASPDAFIVAERMSWASARETTREEDAAYCLLGIFNINMPLIYGEGRKAFLRLQENIIRQEEDCSVLLWSLRYDAGSLPSGLLAPSPAAFCKSSHGLSPRRSFNQLPIQYISARKSWKAVDQKPYQNITTIKDDLYDEPNQRESISLAGRGLQLTLPMQRLIKMDGSSPIAIWTHFLLDGDPLCILAKPYKPVQKQGDPTVSPRLARFMASWLVTIDASRLKDLETKSVYCHSGLIMEEQHLRLSRGFDAQFLFPNNRLFRIKIILPEPASELPTSILSAWPHVGLNNEVVLNNHRTTYGALSVQHDGIAFGVRYTIEQGRLLCVIPVIWKEIPDYSWIPFSQSSAEASMWERASDRCAKRINFPKKAVVVAAAFRKRPSAKKRESAYTLRVAACQAKDAETWMLECLAPQ